MTDPAVTVVITCFNYAGYLPESVGSVLAQTLEDFELIVVDDGSTDDSLAVANALAATDDRITVLTQPNSGQPAIPRNRAVTRARGRYVVSLDADDRMGPTMLERCAATLDADPRLGIAWPQQQEFGSSDALHPHLDWSLARLVRFNYIPCSAMYRRAAWEAAGGYSTNVRGYEDWDLWLGIAEAGFLGRPAHGALWHYRLHGGGVYNEVKAGDQRLKAQVVLNRARLYGDAVLDWARGVLDGAPDALAVPQGLGMVPDLPDPPRSPRVARDRAQRADWYVEVEDLEGPWPGRSLADALEVVGRLGFTAVTVDGEIAARRRATDPVVFPAPFFRADATAQDRAEALAAAIEQTILGGSLRVAGSFDKARTAAWVGVAPGELDPVLAATQAATEGREVPADGAAHVARMAAALSCERVLAGDLEGAARARAVERAARHADIDGARAVAILAYAEELLADPELLRAYGDAFTAADDLTLVIVADDVAALTDAVAAAGLDGDDAADLLAVAEAPAGVDGVLSRREHPGLPRFDEGSLEALRRLAAA